MEALYNDTDSFCNSVIGWVTTGNCDSHLDQAGQMGCLAYRHQLLDPLLKCMHDNT